ncbi:MAG: outer membrane beta-barrel protein [Bacteroidota bacterium]
MKRIIISLFMMLSVQAFAQSKWSIGVMVSSDITSMYTPSNGNSYAQDFDKPFFGYQTGVKGKIDFNRIISAQLGLSMVSHTIGNDRFTLNPLEAGDPFVPEAIQYEVDFKTFQIPLTGSFYFGDKFRFGFTLGAAYNYIYRQDNRTYGYFPSTTRVYLNTYEVTSNNQYLTAIAGLGVEYKIKQMLFRVEPTGSLQLTSLDNGYINDQSRLWSTGLAISGFYHF